MTSCPCSDKKKQGDPPLPVKCGANTNKYYIMDLENIITDRIAEVQTAKEALQSKELKARDEKVACCNKFLEQVSFLGKYGLHLEVGYQQPTNDFHTDYSWPKYVWNVYLWTRYISPLNFHHIHCKEIDGEVYGRFNENILGRLQIDNARGDGWFTAEEFVRWYSKFIR